MGRNDSILKRLILHNKTAIVIIAVLLVVIIIACFCIKKRIDKSILEYTLINYKEQFKNFLIEENYGYGYIEIRIEREEDQYEPEDWIFVVVLRESSEEIRYKYLWKYDGEHSFYKID